MSEKKRKAFSPEFKAKVALEAIKGVKTLKEIALKFEVHSAQVSKWKKMLQENASSIFYAKQACVPKNATSLNIKDSLHLTESIQLSNKEELLYPNNPEFLINYAEASINTKDYHKAIKYLMNAVCILGKYTPQDIYDRLGYAYSKINSFGGTEEENRCWGDKDKHEILADIHNLLKPNLYLEIGVDQGISLSLAKCKAIGIDPRPQLNLIKPLSENAQIITSSSDMFFRDLATTVLHQPPDLVFIDGMHLFEFALRDFINIERYSSPTTLVVIDDIHPCHPAQAERCRRTDSWTGDIWKLHQILQKYRPDLLLTDINAYTTGLLLVVGLDSANSILNDKYQEIIQFYTHNIPPPIEIIERNSSISYETTILPAINYPAAELQGMSSFCTDSFSK